MAIAAGLIRKPFDFMYLNDFLKKWQKCGPQAKPWHF
jgi:hypothetical protein